MEKCLSASQQWSSYSPTPTCRFLFLEADLKTKHPWKTSSVSLDMQHCHYSQHTWLIQRQWQDERMCARYYLWHWWSYWSFAHFCSSEVSNGQTSITQRCTRLFCRSSSSSWNSITVTKPSFGVLLPPTALEQRLCMYIMYMYALFMHYPCINMTLELQRWLKLLLFWSRTSLFYCIWSIWCINLVYKHTFPLSEYETSLQMTVCLNEDGHFPAKMEVYYTIGNTGVSVRLIKLCNLFLLSVFRCISYS